MPPPTEAKWEEEMPGHLESLIKRLQIQTVKIKATKTCKHMTHTPVEPSSWQRKPEKPRAPSSDRHPALGVLSAECWVLGEKPTATATAAGETTTEHLRSALCERACEGMNRTRRQTLPGEHCLPGRKPYKKAEVLLDPDKWGRAPDRGRKNFQGEAAGSEV